MSFRMDPKILADALQKALGLGDVKPSHGTPGLL